MTDTRVIFKISGPEAESFLQGLVTNDLSRLQGGAIYAALLTPQGKYIADFFLAPLDDGIGLDVAGELADTLETRLSMYKLRAKVSIERTGLHVHRGTGEPPEDGFTDPRHPDLGWRAWRDTRQEKDAADWEALRVALGVPQSGVELTPDSFILETGFDRLNGVDFKKGCFVGQEVTARMKHKTELRKGLTTVEIEGAAPVGTAITTEDGKPAGTLYTQSGGKALAYLRFDRAKGPLSAGEATVRWTPQEACTT
ncbi:hypothetical protein SAMN04490248_10491 [Salinihabitans flavidus]|uniref:CAF17 C-terminal domain-containing protein n=1 Tax=Salinihabitans flavidus TaxID=569882 RepID=A0A1H8P0G9_9RHOB|nr:folate-binding protein YgfZ [Salinihabitans flavidus]SEO35410.1 hypothetical protein SAMN04490248_10491 [Salinihabitans flavidus]